jgi:hypothetical protein
LKRHLKVRWGSQEGRTIAELRDDLELLGKGGNWYCSDRFSQIKAAYDWNIPWHVWLGKKLDDLTDRDRLEMMVFLHCKADMEAWEDYVNEPKSMPSNSD